MSFEIKDAGNGMIYCFLCDKKRKPYNTQTVAALNMCKDCTLMVMSKADEQK